MKKLTLAVIFFPGLGLLSAQPLAPQGRYRADQILVKPRVAISELAAVHAQIGSQVRKTFPRFGNLQVVRLPPGVSVEAMIVEYQRSGLVEYAEPDYYGTIASENHPNDPKYVDGSLWNLNNTSQDADIDAPEAWHFRTSAEGVVVAVIDTGVYYGHEDLTNNMWLNPDEIPENDKDDDNNGYVDDIHGINAITGSGDPADDEGHGTHVAGIVGAAGNNGTGVAGVAWRVQIMACKSHDINGEGITSDAIECVDYAIAEGAHIINASWGFTAPSTPLHDAIRVAGNHGIIFVACAHNAHSDIDDDSVRAPRYPAANDTDNIVSVAATTEIDALASYSDFGLVRVDLGAPGGGVPPEPGSVIMSTCLPSPRCGLYCWRGGTSMATPHVSGAFALMKAQFPNESYLQLINRLFSSVDPLPALSGKCQTGGRLNLHKALTSVSSSPRNDSFINSFEIRLPAGQTAITATGNNVDATREYPGEPNHAGTYAAKSVWWHWTATSGGSAEISTYGSTFNTRLAVYTGSALTNLTLVASNYATDSCSWSQVNFTATADTTYRIAVDGYNGAVGSIIADGADQQHDEPSDA